MIELPPEDTYPSLVWVPPEVADFVRVAASLAAPGANLKATMGLVPAGFRATKEQHALGPMGYHGCMGPPERDAPKPRPKAKYPKRDLMLALEWDTPGPLTLPDAFLLRDACGNPCGAGTEAVLNQEAKTYAWYKRPGFDAAYAALLPLKPGLTEKGFAQLDTCPTCQWNVDVCFDGDLVVAREYSGDEGRVLEKEPYTVTIAGPVSHYHHKLLLTTKMLKKQGNAILAHCFVGARAGSQ